MRLPLRRQEAAFAARLAWQQTWRRTRRSLGAFFGIAGALVMVMVQLGFQAGLEESAVRIHHQLNGELVVVSQGFEGFRDLNWFERIGLSQAHAHPQVVMVAPLMLDAILVRDPTRRPLAAIWCIGIDPDQPALRLAEGRPETELLRLPGRVLFDRESRPRYGDILGRLHREGRASLHTALSGATLQTELEVVGSYALGATIAVEGTLLMSETTLSSIVGRSRERLTLAVLRLAPGAEPTQVAAEVQALLPPTLQVLTLAQMIAMEKRLWAEETPIGLVFALCTALGLAVCGIFVWQLLGQLIEDNLQEFAVLRAMGCNTAFFAFALLLTALLYAVAALPLAVLAAALLDRVAAAATLLDTHLTLGRVGFVAAAGLATAVLAGALAGLRLRRADPAALL